MTDCPDCTRLRAAQRDARQRLHHAADDEQATRRAYHAHEADAHPIAAPAPWTPDPPVAVIGMDSTGVTYTFAPAPEDRR